MAFTFFFRDQEILNLIIQHALPDLAARMYINVWDAGCAMGQEPYSLAIMIREQMTHFLFRNVHIYATDIDEQDQFCQIIASGRYETGMVERLPETIRQKYFTPIAGNGHSIINEEIRQAVKFQKHDLLSLRPIRTGFGLILCKNVLLHLTPTERIAVIRMFHQALAEGGYFATEQTQKLPEPCAGLFRQVVPNGQLFQKIS